MRVDLRLKCVRAILCFCVCALPLSAQITGTITDSRTRKPVSDVEVFIHGTTRVALSDDAGVFELQGLHPGFADLVLYRKGYKLFKSSMRLQAGKGYTLNLSIEPGHKEKSRKGDDNTEQTLQRLKEALVGKENDASTILLNVETLSLVRGSQGISVKSSEPLVINNFSVGYQMRWFLQQGLLTPDKTNLRGLYYYQPMQATGSGQDREWAEERLAKYLGSAQHFLRALVNGISEQEGFECLTSRGDLIDSRTLIVQSSVPGYYKLILPDTMEVVYRSGDSLKSRSRFFVQGPAAANENGILLKSEDLKIEGPMNMTGMIPPLPRDYKLLVPKDEDFVRFYEKTYVQTDKPYYYPGEPLWFKGYIHYQRKEWRDSLCRVMYVELINAKKIVIHSRTLKIDSGFFYGDFILPDSLPAGSYYLRAYTNLSRNFGSSALFIKPVPVLNMTDKADRAQEVRESLSQGPLTITSDKPSYRTREKITLTFHVKDSTGQPQRSNLSLSVTDAEQVVGVQEPCTILNEFPFTGEMKLSNMDFKYGAEFGVSFMAKFVNDKGEPEKTTVDILQMPAGTMMVAETDDEGVFWRTGLQFYDTAQFSFKSKKAKGKPYGRVILLPRETPEVDFKGSRLSMVVKKMESPQRLISEYEVPKDSKLLEAVTVNASGIKEGLPSQGYRSQYGIPDKVIKGEEVNMKVDLLYALVGKVPGLMIVPSTGAVVFSRAVGTSITLPPEPLVTVNDVPMEGRAGDILRTINPAMVDRIAFTRRIDVIYGSLGKNGVIAVYTKMGTTGFEETEKEKNFEVLRIAGYSRPRSFRSPDYDDPQTDQSRPDYRATIYWNPWIAVDDKTGEATVSFFSADLEGRYRVVAEGVTGTGKPVRQVYFITVDNQ